MPTTSPPAPKRRAAAVGRCTPRRSRGTLKDDRCRPEPCGVCKARPTWTVEHIGDTPCRQGPRRALDYVVGLFKKRPFSSTKTTTIAGGLARHPDHYRRAPRPLKTPNLLTSLLTPKTVEQRTPVVGMNLGFYNQSLLSSRSMVRIHQGAYSKDSSSTGFLVVPRALILRC